MNKQLLGCAIALALPAAFAQTADDFKQGAQQRGCQSIPYSNHRDKCVQEQSDAKDWCEGKGNMSCGDLDTRGLRDQIRSLEDGIRSAQSANKRDAVSDLENKKRAAQVTLEGNRKEAERRLYNNEKCIDFRKRTQQVFRDVESRLSNDRNDSAKKASWDD